MAERTPDEIQDAMDRMYRRSQIRVVVALLLALAVVALIVLVLAT